MGFMRNFDNCVPFDSGTIGYGQGYWQHNAFRLTELADGTR